MRLAPSPPARALRRPWAALVAALACACGGPEAPAPTAERSPARAEAQRHTEEPPPSPVAPEAPAPVERAAPAVDAAAADPEAELEDEGSAPLGGRSAPDEVEAAEEEPEPPAVGRAILGYGLREVDRDAFAWQGREMKAEKVHDATKKKNTPYKINVYRDPGHKTVTRLRIDLDRDDRWDEKWTFDGEAVRRQIAPADDENYTQSFFWVGNGWAAAD